MHLVPPSDATDLAPWSNNIVGYDEVDPRTLVPNPKNWRLHPDAQRLALLGTLDELGWLQPVTWNVASGHLLDGHLRRDVAILRNEPTIPRCIVDLDPDLEAKALATIDPLTAMAEADDDLLRSVLAEVQTDDFAVGALLESLASEVAVHPSSGQAPSVPADERYHEQYGVIVLCDDEQEQETTYNVLTEMGYEVKVVVT